MTHIRVTRWSMLSLFVMALLSVGIATSASAQGVDGSTTMISIDAPAPGQQVRIGEEIGIGGWAADVAVPGGIDAVEIFIDGRRDEGGRLLGKATYGKPRADVASSLGSSAFTNVGFDLVWKVSTTAGPHTAYVYVHSGSGWNYEIVSFTVGGTSASTTPGSLGSGQSQQNPFATGATAQSGSLYGQTSPAGQSAANQFVGNPVNMGGTAAGTYGSATGQSYAGAANASLYGGNSYAGGTNSVTGAMGSPYLPGTASSPSYPFTTNAGSTTPCTCSTGSTYAAANPYGTGATYAAGNPYSTGAAYQAGYVYSNPSNYTAGYPYSNTSIYPASNTYAAGNQYGYANPSPYTAAATYPTGSQYSTGSPYGVSYAANPYGNASAYSSNNPYAGGTGYSSGYSYPSYPAYSGY